MGTRTNSTRSHTRTTPKCRPRRLYYYFCRKTKRYTRRVCTLYYIIIFEYKRYFEYFETFTLSSIWYCGDGNRRRTVMKSKPVRLAVIGLRGKHYFVLCRRNPCVAVRVSQGRGGWVVWNRVHVGLNGTPWWAHDVTRRSEFNLIFIYLVLVPIPLCPSPSPRKNP